VYKLAIKKNLDKNFKRLKKKDRKMLELIDKKVQEILDNPYRFKSLKKPLQNKKRNSLLYPAALQEIRCGKDFI